MEWFNTPEFQKHVEDLMAEHHAPGLAIAIIHNDTIASVGYGLASVEPRKECTPDTLFDIASASKSLTGASIGLLVADEEHPVVQYEAPVSRILPDDFVMPNEELTRTVTVEDILSHRTGMAGHDESYQGPSAERPDTAASVTRNLRNLPLAAHLRTKYIYCNMMFTVATHLVEKVSGTAFPDFLEQRFFQPLQMTSTNLQPLRARSRGFGDRIATGYAWKEDTRTYTLIESPESPEGQGAGSIISSVNDYIKWVQAMMKKNDPINEDIYNGLIKSRNVVDPSHEGLLPFKSPSLVGLGWEVAYYRGRMIVSHDGAIPGFSSTHFFLPDLQFGGALFGNSEGADNVIQAIMHEMIDAILDIPSSERLDWNQTLNEHREAQGDGKDDPKDLYPDVVEFQPLPLSLDAYTGDYWNVGYHGMKVQIKDDQLFIDATHRSFAFTLTLEHVYDGDKFVAYLTNAFDGDVIPFKAGFKFENGKVVSLGLHLAEELEEYIWFDKITY